MNLEGITLQILTKNLQTALNGGKIAKIFMPTPASLLLVVRNGKDTISLLADLSGDSPLLYLPDDIPENPDKPPAFCMLLRKHLEDGRINKIEQLGLDRIINMEIDTIGPAKQIITKKLIFELTGRNSNIIFAENEIVIDALKHISKAVCSFRQILPNQLYNTPPEQNGLSFIYAAPADIFESIIKHPAKNVLQSIISTTTGIGKFTASEILFRSDINLDTIDFPVEKKNRFIQELTVMQNNIKAHIVKKLPVYGILTQTNRMNTIVLTQPLHLDQTKFLIKEFPDLNAAINFAAKLVPIQSPEKDILDKAIFGALVRTEKKIIALETDLKTAENAEYQKIIADTLMSNIYLIKKGITSCTLNNIYTNEKMEIALSPLLTPVENAQVYYKRYNKYKRAIEEINKQKQETKDLLQYLQSLDTSLQTATNKTEVAEIKQELISEGIISENKKGKNKASLPKSAPLSIQLSHDTVIYIGKNNRQNDFVSFTIAKPHDLWFHTKGFPGSHVILKTSLPKPTDAEIATAANLAAYFSKARNSSNVPVDCTEKRYVKKPSGAKPGFVIYTNQQTLYVTPDPSYIDNILNNHK
ncbi:MAG: NFACT family protein [Acidaminococcaceae bacterium]